MQGTCWKFIKDVLIITLWYSHEFAKSESSALGITSSRRSGLTFFHGHGITNTEMIKTLEHFPDLVSPFCTGWRMEVLADYHVGKIQVALFCLAGYIYSLEKNKQQSFHITVVLAFCASFFCSKTWILLHERGDITGVVLSTSLSHKTVILLLPSGNIVLGCGYYWGIHNDFGHPWQKEYC